MAVNGWKGPEMSGMVGNGLNWLVWPEMAVNGSKWQEWLERAVNGLTLLDMDGNDCK